MADLCHLCGHPLADAIHVWHEGRPFTEQLATVACVECSLVQTSPHPTAAEVTDYYASGRYRLEFPDLPRRWIDDDGKPDQERHIDPGDPLYQLTCERHGEHAARRLVDAFGLRRGASVLEVGGGDGCVNVAMRALGIDAVMVERDPAKAAEAAGLGAAVLTEYVTSSFDMVIAFQVIEHFSDPVGELTAMVQCAKPGGLVFVEVPNVTKPYVSLSHFFQKPHVVNYSPHTLAAALRRAGLDDVHTAEDGTVLLGWGVRGNAGPRQYEPHGGPMAAEIVGNLHKWEAERVARETATKRDRDFLDPKWRAMAADPDLRDDPRDRLATLDHIASEFTKWRDVGTDAIYSIAKLCKRIDDEHGDLETWHPNPWVRGYYAGVAAERQRQGVILGNVSNGLLVRLNRKASE